MAESISGIMSIPILLGVDIGTSKISSVAVAMGDNQAAFLGTVREKFKMVLLNLGTGGQLCVPAPHMERPWRAVWPREFFPILPRQAGGLFILEMRRQRTPANKDALW